MILKKIISLVFVLALSICFLMPSSSIAQSVDDLTIMTEIYPPYNYKEKGELYYVFHKDTSDILLEKMQTALDELKKDGEYQKILDKYLK